MALTDDQIEQYSRQIILPELGGIGQRKLLEASCLLLGSGPALETAATYLAGAGVGTLHVSDGSSPTMAYAPLAGRNRDVHIACAPSRPAPSDYQVILAAHTPAGGLAAGCARLGEIAVGADTSGAHVTVVPRTGGCIECRAAPPEEADRDRRIDEAAAGALAALAALLWLAEIAPRPEPKRLTLAPGAPCWTESPLGPTAGCPRPCRP